MQKQVLVIIAIFIGISIGYGQHQNVQIPYSASSYDPEEPCIYVNPKNTNEFIAGANH